MNEPGNASHGSEAVWRRRFPGEEALCCASNGQKPPQEEKQQQSLMNHLDRPGLLGHLTRE